MPTIKPTSPPVSLRGTWLSSSSLNRGCTEPKPSGRSRRFKTELIGYYEGHQSFEEHISGKLINSVWSLL